MDIRRITILGADTVCPDRTVSFSSLAPPTDIDQQRAFQPTPIILGRFARIDRRIDLCIIRHGRFIEPDPDDLVGSVHFGRPFLATHRIGRAGFVKRYRRHA